MSTVRAKATETMPIKKTLKKKVVDKAPVAKVEKVVKVTNDTKPSKESDVEVVEKIPKKINVKATLADICGLNLSVAKIKNIISSLVRLMYTK